MGELYAPARRAVKCLRHPADDRDNDAWRGAEPLRDRCINDLNVIIPSHSIERIAYGLHAIVSIALDGRPHSVGQGIGLFLFAPACTDRVEHLNRQRYRAGDQFGAGHGLLRFQSDQRFIGNGLGRGEHARMLSGLPDSCPALALRFAWHCERDGAAQNRTPNSDTIISANSAQLNAAVLTFATVYLLGRGRQLAADQCERRECAIAALVQDVAQFAAPHIYRQLFLGAQGSDVLLQFLQLLFVAHSVIVRCAQQRVHC